MNIKFRKANLKDVENIIELCNECFNEHTNITKAKRMFKKTEKDDNQIYLVGYINDELVAHAKITIVPTIYEEMSIFAILNHVCVHRKYRGQKIGTALLKKCVEVAKKRGCKNIELWSRNFRKDAHKLYDSYDFKVLDAKFFTKEI